MSTSDSARYDEASEVKPSNSRKASTGSVIDPRPGKYPSTQDFASSKESNLSQVEHCRHARRPGGDYRASHGFKTIACHCNTHPCICGTEEAMKQLEIDKTCNVNVGDKKKSMGRHM